MKVLFFERIWLQGQGGGPNCARAYINALAEIADEITLVYPTKSGKEIEGISNKVSNLIPIPYELSKASKVIRLLKGKLNPFYNLPQYLFEPNSFDIVFFSSSYASQGLIKRFHKIGVKVITLHHNFELKYAKDNMSPLKFFFTLYPLYKCEKKSLKYSDLNLFLTSYDQISLCNFYGKIGKVSNSLIFEYKEYPKKNIIHKTSNKTTFIITGDLSFVQSNKSIIPWINLYYPVLKEICPNSTLIIAGRNPSFSLIEKCKKLEIKLIPSPKDMDEVLKKGDIYICPTNLGSGIKLRIMDGLKWGMPVLTHKVSARGYEELERRNILKVYDTIESFKSKLKSLLDEPINKSEILSTYDSLFSFQSGIKRLSETLLKNNIIS